MSLRQPTCRINGIPVIEAEVLVHRYQSANDFTATLSMTAIEQKGGSVSQWLNAKQSVSIIGGDRLGKTKALIQGTVDAAEADWHKRTIRIQGRDEATAKLIDSTVDPQKDQFQNKSSEDVVRELAGRNGLSVQTDGGGGGQDKAGRTHVKDEYNLITGQESAWNVIRQLAEREGKVAYVDDQNKLHFVKPENSGGGATISIRYHKPGPGHPEGNFTELRVTTLFPAKEIRADATSFHSRDKKTYSGNAGGGEGGGGSGDGGGGGGGGGSDGQGGGLKIETPGMKQEQVQAVAKGFNVLTARHFKRLTFSGPGDTSADVHGQVNLSGTGTENDDTYDIDSIRWVFDGPGSNFTMTVDARTKGQGGEGE